MAPKCSSSGWSVRMILRHKVVGIGSGRAAGVSCTEVFGGNWLHPCLHKLQLLLNHCTFYCVRSGFNPDTKAVEALTSCAQRS